MRKYKNFKFTATNDQFIKTTETTLTFKENLENIKHRVRT